MGGIKYNRPTWTGDLCPRNSVNGRIIDGSDGDTSRIRGRAKGCCPAIGTHIHLRACYAGRLVPRPIRDRRTVGILSIRHKAQAVGVAKQERTGVGHRPDCCPATARVVFPGPIATDQPCDCDTPPPPHCPRL